MNDQNSPGKLRKNSRSNWTTRQWIVNSKIQQVFVGYAVAMGILFFSMGLLASNIFDRIVAVRSAGEEGLSVFDITSFSFFMILVGMLIVFGIIRISGKI